MFVDEIRVSARAGRGGRGCVAFLRETFRPKGGPSGGNGGRGGDVILEADHDLNNLVAQYYQSRLIAEPGGNGLGKGMDGRSGKDLVVKVPCGTLVWRLWSRRGSGVVPGLKATVTPTAETAPTGTDLLPVSASQRPLLCRATGGPPPPANGFGPEEKSAAARTATEKGELIADLTLHGQKFVLCTGGRGGLGNRNFATARHQTPRFAQPGEPGEEAEVLLELRLMADVGLVGYPNAGKSTLLSAISKARPKIAPYPFTTLHPQVGIVEYQDWQRLTVCDVPGLIEGAYRDVGLGHAFLRHIERCQVLVLLLDMAGLDGRKPWHDYQQLLKELALYDPALVAKPRLVVANKMDEPAAEPNLRSFKRRVPRTRVLPIAAAFGIGIEEFKQAIGAAVSAVNVSREPGAPAPG